MVTKFYEVHEIVKVLFPKPLCVDVNGEEAAG